jgi:hypothetical protein
MIYFYALVLSLMQSLVLFSPQQEETAQNWQVVDDRVMGGLSQGQVAYTAKGHLLYTGHVTTQNNGGFSSVRRPLQPAAQTKGFSQVVLRLKGDGARYQFRLKADANQRHSYIQYFETTGEWQEVVLNLEGFYPSFRGRTLDLPNFEAETLAEIRFLIANKKEQDFKLQVKEVLLK